MQNLSSNCANSKKKITKDVNFKDVVLNVKNRIEISSVGRIERRNRGFDHGAGNRIDILSRDTLCPATLLQKTAKTHW